MADEWIRIEAVCENNHSQILRVAADLGRDYAENLAGLLDGTSPMYLHKPDENSPLSKCGICGTPITCTVS